MPAAVSLGIGAAAGALALAAFGPIAVALGGLSVFLFAVSQGRVQPSRPERGSIGGMRLVPLAIGVVVLGLRGLAVPASAPAPGALPGGAGPWVGTVEAVGSTRGGTRPAVILLETDPIAIAATLPWYPAVMPGDRVQTVGRLELPPADGYGLYLRRIGVAGTVRASSLAILPGAGGFERGLEGLRRGAGEAIARAVPEPEAGLATGILVGLRDRVDRDLAAAFTTAGVSHVIAISGWDIAIVATSIGALAGNVGRRRRSVLICLAILAYVAFVGPSPSVVRAGAMATLVLLARELGRPSSAAAAMGWAVLGLLLVNPAWIDDAGFRLSVLATAGLLAWGSRLTRWLAGRSPGRARAWLAESLGVSFAAQAATLPIILLEFGRLSLVAPLVNLVVVPLVAPAMAAGVALVGGLIAAIGGPGAVATVVGLPAWFLFGVMIAAVRIGAGVPMASLTLDPPMDVAAAIGSAGAVFGVVLIGGRLRGWPSRHRGTNGEAGPRAAAAWQPALPAGTANRRTAPSTVTSTRSRAPKHRSRAVRLAAIGLAGATIALALALVHRPDGSVRVVVMDVGQGDAILVEGDRGGRMLIDGGPDPQRLSVVLDERLPPWDHRIDTLVLTHPHEDHVAGLALLLSRYRIGRVFEPGMIGPGPGYKAWAAFLAAGGPPRGTLVTGDRLTLDDIRFRVLWPDPGSVPEHPPDAGTSINNVSIVLLGEFDGSRFLLAGDIEQAIDPVLVARGLPTVDLLKVAHHGSRTASTQDFLAAVRPRIAIVSAGLGNPYGHPAPSTIERLHAIAKETYRTDLDGTVEVRFDGTDIRARAGGGRPVPAPTRTSGAAQPSIATTAADTALFACSIPIGATVGVASAAPGSGTRTAGSRAEPPALPRRVETGRPWWPTAGTRAGRPIGRLPTDRTGPLGVLAYHRLDDGPLTLGGGRAAPLPRSPALAPAARARRGRGGRLARSPSGADPYRLATRSGPRARRGGRAPP